MKIAKLVYVSFLFVVFVGVPHSWSLDAGDDVTQVEIVEQPIKVKSAENAETIDVISRVQLDAGENHNSQYIDVQGFSRATLFVTVLPETIFSEPSETPLYSLDAFFSLESKTTKYIEFGNRESRLGDIGVQEFGSTLVREGKTEEAVYTKLTTGKTANRALVTPIYGPYLRVNLTNHTAGKSVEYRVTAYLVRE